MMSLFGKLLRKGNEAGSGQSESRTKSGGQVIDAKLVHADLANLLEHIEVPDRYAKKAEALKQRLYSKDPADQPLEEVLNRIVSLLIEINLEKQPKQEDIDLFLVHITEKIEELGEAVTGSGFVAMAAHSNRSQLERSVSEQMSELEQQSLVATQLEPLKQIIASRIAQITLEIQEYRQKETLQGQKFQSQMDNLNQKIRAMETETKDLKVRLLAARNHALRDALTGLPNRMAYDERVSNEIALWQRYHSSLCLIIWDIDHFKGINDHFGHQIGDLVLVQVANLFAEHIRGTDFIARFGGEEFVMLLPHTGKQSALKLANKLRELIGQNGLTTNVGEICVTVSCGISQFVTGDDHDSTFSRADRALYLAKEHGRNQCWVDDLPD